MSFKFFKLQYWDKRSADVRRCNCAVLPYICVQLLCTKNGHLFMFSIIHHIYEKGRNDLLQMHGQAASVHAFALFIPPPLPAYFQ